jgi:hypothetical protein
MRGALVGYFSKVMYIIDDDILIALVTNIEDVDQFGKMCDILEKNGGGISVKIAIIGNGGSGKSTLALVLHKKLNLPLHHLDQYYWNPGWQRVGSEDFERIHRELCDQEQWIIEGVGQRVFAYRFVKADTIIFLDVPTAICLWRVIKRACRWWRGTTAHCSKGM